MLTSYFLLIVSSIHDVNALRGAMGQPDSVLSANLWAGGTSFTATLAYPNDVRTVYTWTLLPYVKNYGETFSFYASDGRVLIRFPSPYLRNAPTLVDVERMHGEELQVTRFTASYEEAFKRELLEFDDCVRTGRAPRTDAPAFARTSRCSPRSRGKFPKKLVVGHGWETGSEVTRTLTETRPLRSPKDGQRLRRLREAGATAVATAVPSLR